MTESIRSLNAWSVNSVTATLVWLYVDSVDTLTVSVASPIESIEVRFANDGPGRNLFLYDIRIDGSELDLTEGVVVRASNGAETPVDNGDEVGLWFNSSYVLSVSLPTPPTATQLVEVDVARTGQGGTEADVLVNGEEVVSDHVLIAARHQGVDTLSYASPLPIESIEVRFANDGPGRNLFLYDIRIDGSELDLTEGVVVRASNGTETAVNNENEVALWVNSSYVVDVQPVPPTVTVGRANNWNPADTQFNWGGGQTEARVTELLSDDFRDRNLDFDQDGRLQDATQDTESINVSPADETPVATILAALGAHPETQHVTIELGPHDYHFEKKLKITRGNITIKDAGINATTIVHDFDDGEQMDHAIEFHLNTLSERFGFNEDLTPARDSLLTDISVRDFTMTYAIGMSDFRAFADPVPGQDACIAPGPLPIAANDAAAVVEDLREISSQNFFPKYAAPAVSRGNCGDLISGRQAAIAFEGVLEANIIDIGADMVGSHFLGIYESVGVYADGLVADGTLNRGGGGNGYALEMIHSHDSVIKFDLVNDYRHISINNASHFTDAIQNWSTGNVIGVEYSNTNMDIHTLSEDNNILYAENIIASPYIQTQPIDENGNDGWTGTWRWSYRLDDERMAWDLFDPRSTDNTKRGGRADDNNSWFADNQIAAGSLNMTGEPVDGQNYPITATMHENFDETLYASENGGHIYGGFGDDTLTGSGGQNTFVYANDTGNDTIHQFGPEDTIAIARGTHGINDLDDFTALVGEIEPVNGQVTIDLNGQIITIPNAGFFIASEHVEIDDFVFYNPTNKDYAFFVS